MAWSWRYETAEGRVLDDEALPGELFSSRGDAESWLGESWRDLVEAGADQVTLLEDDRVVYTMSLHEDD
ncbi:hypothetical protein F4561_001621 [Lipingzhangella halophila]|uniref:Uncharacterized protein n=1 Tax=Lipingzhangella halophila TaxID=1783352 RepID=A0A7W7RF39_9ACTN|nr:hypothetical protein [Lipingzhangella halophila]MBB4930801.1 hypothetical protein [Lipingzhangella halophila]